MRPRIVRFAARPVPFAILPPVRALRTLIVAAVLAVGLAAPAAAQTTTTMPPVRSIPVTPAPTTTAAPAATTTTTARAAAPTPTPVQAAAAAAVEDPLADTGIAADKLVPLAFLLIAVGALLDAAARRNRRTAYSYL